MSKSPKYKKIIVQINIIKINENHYLYIIAKNIDGIRPKIYILLKNQKTIGMSC